MAGRTLQPLTSRHSKMQFANSEISLDQNIDSALLQPDDELKEVSVQLQQVRKRYDQTKETNQKKRVELEKLKKELEKLSSVAQSSDGDQRAIEVRIELLQQQLYQTKQRVDEELFNKKVYDHMMMRMKKDKIAYEVKANGLQNNLKSARQILEEEKSRQRKTNEECYNSRQLLRGIRTNLQEEKRKKDERIAQLEQSVRTRREAAMRREERMRRQAEIADAAAHEDKDAEEIRLREIILLHRFWYNVLKWKLQKEEQNAADVEEAFQQIRAATGISNVNEVIEHFLTRDEQKQELMKAVQEAEDRLDKLREESTQTRKKYQELNLLQTEGVSSEFSKEVSDLNHQIQEKQKQLANANQKLENTSEVYDKVKDWGVKILERLNPDMNIKVPQSSHIQENPDALVQLYMALRDEVKKQMTPILERKDEIQELLGKQARKSTKELIKEIASDEFVAKNQRIRLALEDDTESENND